jgi:hypothetical protein
MATINPVVANAAVNVNHIKDKNVNGMLLSLMCLQIFLIEPTVQ